MEATPPATPRHTMFPLWLLLWQLVRGHADTHGESLQPIIYGGFRLLRLIPITRSDTPYGQS